MSNKVTLGGDRLGAGKKQQVELKNYERSTHDLSYVWRSSMSAGTLVPFMSEVGLPGDYFEVDLECDVKTLPTVGPLFGSYKVQLDVFQCPMRLFNAKLHMNLLNIGLDMSQIKLPQLVLTANGTKLGDNDQVNSSSILSYLNIRGVGRTDDFTDPTITRRFNAIPYLSYWEIYKNYYSNKQEEVGAYIHNNQNYATNSIDTFKLKDSTGTEYSIDPPGGTPVNIDMWNGTGTITFNGSDEPDVNSIFVRFTNGMYPDPLDAPLKNIFNKIVWNSLNNTLECSEVKINFWGSTEYIAYIYNGTTIAGTQRPKVEFFPLENIDNMRESILSDVFSTSAFQIDNTTQAPYGTPLSFGEAGYCILSPQEGLGLKTYQSDLFNNWISTDWIDGTNGINQITAIDTSSGEFTINTLQLSNKIYEMLNRIAVSGGTYDDWLNAVYTHERTRSQETPMYMGGLIKELGFQEVISNATTDVNQNEQALGTLAGRGVLLNKHKGGKVHIKVDEPSYIIGIVSLTPRIDYSQGNKWDVNLKTLDDLHKPQLDEIGFQDLITDQLAYFDTFVQGNNVLFQSAGKQPAWINYMTNVNQVRGTFADVDDCMFMTLNRRYEYDINGGIKDLTTYIDPAKFNHVFADARLDAQNFWTQIAVNINARRKMSARLMPNL